ncbi:SpoIID/LytB domain-containing protein [Jatrophihabitans fulvus]
MNPFPPRVLRSAVAALALAVGTVTALSVAGPAAEAGTITIKPTGSVIVTSNGNGHGHGMSQYGAYGAARQGRTYRQILAFYYPGTTLTTLPRTIVRVRLSGFPTTVTVQAEAHLTVTGNGGASLPVTGYKQYRLVASGSGFTLQRLGTAKGATWKTYRTGLPNRSEFWRNNAWSTRLYRADGTSTRFFGYVRAVRSGSSAYVVNRVGLDNYTAGVVASEIPTSWSAQAVNAQAVAARTYARYEVVHTPSGSEYDICDTTQCQVYNGRYSYDSSGQLMTWRSAYTPAVTATSNQVLQYKGQTIFSQFSASNGGYTASGGQPYLVSRKDTYDTMSLNPYIRDRTKVSARSLAAYFGLAKVTGLSVTKRDGHGSWGGRVLAGTVKGVGSNGKARTVSVTGFDLQYAFGIGTTMFTVAPA